MGPDCFSPEELADLHAHLIRSPPPLYWPAKGTARHLEWRTGSSKFAYSAILNGEPEVVNLLQRYLELRTGSSKFATAPS